MRTKADGCLRPLTSEREDVSIRHLMDEPQTQRFSGRDGLRREEETQGFGPPEDARQASCPSPSRQEAQARARMGEDGAYRRVPQVARERQIQPAAYAVPINGSNEERPRTFEATKQELTPSRESERLLRRQTMQFMEISTRGKSSSFRSREDHCRDISPSLDLLDKSLQVGEHGEAEYVRRPRRGAARAIQNDDPVSAPLLHAEMHETVSHRVRLAYSGSSLGRSRALGR